MNLRQRGYCIEATYKKDREIRDISDSFHHAFVKFLEKRSDELVPRKSDGGFGVHARKFWRHPMAKNLGVILVPRSGHLTGAVGKAGRLDVVVLPILDKFGDNKNLHLKVNIDAVIHEMTHILDPGRESGGSIALFHDDGSKAYYNSPAEWNAFWQEGASKLERVLSSPIISRADPERKKKVVDSLVGGRTIRGMISSASKFWDRGFLESMNKKTKRKFMKRLAQLWKSLTDRGMI